MAAQFSFAPEDLKPLEASPGQAHEIVQGSEPRRINNLTLVEGKKFLATTLSGDITPAGATDVGLFDHDTRFLSQLELRVNGHQVAVLSAASPRSIVSKIELTNTSMVRASLDLPENTVHIRREQLLAGAFFDRLDFHNFKLQPVELEVELRFDADFADVFQVRGMLRRRTGRYFEPQIRANELVYVYLGRDDEMRRTWLRFDPEPRVLEAHRACYTLHLQPGEQRRLSLQVTAEAGNAATREAPPVPEFAACVGRRRESYNAWQHATTRFESSDDLLNQCLQTAANDFFSLRIPFGATGECGVAPPGAGAIIAAGIPWFATVFGRDSLIAGYQSLALHPLLAKETLRYLAERQGTRTDDWRDEEPGKIMHEWREGEMTRAGEVPHSPYYGSVDSTPLFLIVLDEVYRWTGDAELLHDLLPAARRAMEWIESHGDLDGDGFVEYLKRSSQGLDNQGWKDSSDSNLRRDGALAPAPLALCEVQGYCYDARYRLARVLRAAGDVAGASRLRRDAVELARRFEAAFWSVADGYYFMALDGEKQPQRAISSNAGHLLWSRILSRERARQVARRLMRDDMYSGWGIRTLAASEPTFNPLSYHRGSVWPHDNSLIAQGLAFYDLKQPLLRIFTGLYQAAAYFREHRLPELFVGVQRGTFDQPVNYPVSCSPQAWASGAWILMLTAMLGLRPNAEANELRVVNPVLPEWLQWLRIHDMRIGNSAVSLEFSRRGERTFCNLLAVQGSQLAVSVDFTRKSAVEQTRQ